MDLADGIFNTGTATVAAGGTTVTFQGAPNLQAAVRKGDRFGSHVGLPIRILEVASNTATLAYPWPGPAQTAAPYEIVFSPYDLAYRKEFSEIIDRYGRGSLPGLAEVDGALDTILYGTGPNTFARTALTPFARTLLDDANGAAMYGTLGQIPNAQVRNDLPPDKAFRRGNILGAVSQSAGVPTGALSTGWISNANGWYKRDADGTQTCLSPVTAQGQQSGVTYIIRYSWTFPVAFIEKPSMAGGFLLTTTGGLGSQDFSSFVVSATATSPTAGDVSARTGTASAISWGPGVTLPANAIATGRWF